MHLTKRLSRIDEKPQLPKAAEQTRVSHLRETAKQTMCLKPGSRMNSDAIPVAVFLSSESLKYSAGRYVARRETCILEHSAYPR